MQNEVLGSRETDDEDFDQRAMAGSAIGDTIHPGQMTIETLQPPETQLELDV